MTIEFKDGRYFAALWYLEDKGGNWMGAAYRDEDGSWHLVYRHRYYVDDVMDETSEDKKSWHEFDAPSDPDDNMSEEEMEARTVDAVDAMLAVMKSTGYGVGYEVQKITPRSDVAKVCFDMLTAQKFAHAKLMTTPEIPISMRPVARGQT